MKNKSYLVIVSLLAAASLVYFLIIYLPEKELFARQEHCTQLGNQYLKDEESGLGSSASDSYLGKGMYVYSKKLKTCLYANNLAFITEGISKTEYYIIDLSTNEKIASYNLWEEGCDSCEGNQITIDAENEYQELYEENFLGK